MQERFSKYSTKHISFIGLLVLGSLIFMVKSSFAVSPNIVSNDIPIKINADDMVYDIDNNTVAFVGNVVVTQGEFVMRSAKMDIFMKDKEAPKENVIAPPKNVPLTGAIPVIPKQSQNTKSEENNIERIEAYDGVTFDYGPQSGTSESAVYESQKRLLTMRGNPIVKEGENVIQGNIIRYFINERRSEVIGSEGKRVEAIFSNNN